VEPNFTDFFGVQGSHINGHKVVNDLRWIQRLDGGKFVGPLFLRPHFGAALFFGQVVDRPSQRFDFDIFPEAVLIMRCHAMSCDVMRCHAMSCNVL
jgi:hypothetical protein